MQPNESKRDVNMMNPLVWAYIGDSVYEMKIRNYFIDTTNKKVHELHICVIRYVKASTQAKFLKALQDKLSEEEQEIVRRTRNTQNHHVPKNADPSDYMYATALEGLIGYLYLNKENERLKKILDIIIEMVQKEEKK